MTEYVSIQNQQQYYNQYWNDRSRQLNPHEILRLSEILAAMSLVREDTMRRKVDLQICDFGSGWGWLSNYLSDFGSVVGVELSDDAVARAQQEFPHIEFVCADITQWKPDHQFDLVVSSEVLEHVPDKAAFCETVRQILRPGGWFILTTPNKRVQREWDISNGTGQLIEDWCTMNELHRLLPDFDLVDHHTFLFDFCYCGKFRWLSAPKLHRALKTIGLMSLYNHLRSVLDLGLYQVLVARKSNR